MSLLDAIQQKLLFNQIFEEGGENRSLYCFLFQHVLFILFVMEIESHNNEQENTI